MRKQFFSATSGLTLSIALLLSSCHWPDRVNGPEEPPAEVYEISKENHGLEIHCERATSAPPAKISVIFSVTDSRDEPITGLTCGDFLLAEDSLKISAHESAFRVQSSPQDLHLSTLLLLDLSGSILGSSFDSLRVSAQSFIRGLLENANPARVDLAISWFDGAAEIHRLIDFTSDTLRLQRAVASLNAGMSTDRATNLHGAIISGVATIKAEVKKKRADLISHGALVVFTDGKDNAARFTPRQALNAVDSCGPNVSVYTIGLGGEIDSTHLRAFGKNGFAFAKNLGALQQFFEATATHIQNRLMNRYLLEYCTPKRNGRHSLTIMARAPENRDRFGTVTISFPASGFTGGCFLEGACSN